MCDKFRYLEHPIKKYLDDLAAKKPAPGGGSAAALGAAIGAGLMAMVANYTVGNPRYKDGEEDAADILVKTEMHRSRLQELVDEDVEAYGRLSRKLKEYAKDPAGLDGIYKEAATPPFEICRIAGECLALCERLAKCGNKNLITDTAIAAILLEGAFFSAKYNVYINLKYIRDTEYIGKIHNYLSPMEESIPKLKGEILELCEDVIAK